MNLHEKELREVYADTLIELMEKNPRVLCLEADLGKANGTVPRLPDAFPNRFFDTGVAEANMVGIAAGLANEGMIPFCASFTCFASRRVYDQLTISVAYANNPVKIIGTAPGVTATYNGATHMCFQDMAIIRSMPNMHVYAPADAYELRSVIRYMASTPRPIYMQLIREKMPKIFDEDYVFDPLRARVLTEGEDVTLVTTGLTTKIALDASETLKKEGIRAEHLHYPSVKPFDADTLVGSVMKTGAAVTVENQNVIGGLGSAVCEVLSERHPVKVKRLGVQDRFGEVGSLDYLIETMGIGVKDIVEACKEMKHSR
ncbi:MAG: transketolase family protein [Deltaproteobacteria bacterium]|nr:transketolase family protein [Deltaproteobacteria bacterium]MBW1961867.1 transketolase family protein [Deltaproteobacteria bacterium]MBW1995406.1 transketolase family protein [Deltaproteobacteria bacterium]MBW2152592.1 transketolase family protein [Deltaproteobacteria bacterium]